MTKDDIKSWLDREGLDRAWLAGRLSVAKGTVNNWLSTRIEIPARKLALIRELMDRPIASSAPTPEAEEMTLLLRLGEADYDAVSRAALRDGEPIREWAARKVVESARD